MGDLERLVGILNMRLGTTEDTAYSIGYAYGSPRLESHRESRDVSPRLPKRELQRWLVAFLDGVDAERAASRAFSESTFPSPPVSTAKWTDGDWRKWAASHV